MLIEKITAASFINGVLRLETSAIDAQGKLKVSGNIEIPGNLVANVINEISNGAQQISEKLASTDEKKDKPKGNKSGTSSNDPSRSPRHRHEKRHESQKLEVVLRLVALRTLQDDN